MLFLGQDTMNDIISHKGSFTRCGSGCGIGAAMGLKCFAAATAAQNGVGTHLLVAPCGTSAATAVASARVNNSTCNNGIQLIAAPLSQPLPLRVNEP